GGRASELDFDVNSVYVSKELRPLVLSGDRLRSDITASDVALCFAGRGKYDQFICPEEDTYCCGEEDEQYCCTKAEFEALKSSLSTGAIAAIVICSLLGVVVMGLIIFCACKFFCLVKQRPNASRPMGPPRFGSPYQQPVPYGSGGGFAQPQPMPYAPPPPPPMAPPRNSCRDVMIKTVFF
uniref:Cysteine and tyrosine-rich protein 1 n=1 Tax=Macrostomum lignano TaxID=282301 RepID=A0A1I8JJP6_9PLAT